MSVRSTVEKINTKGVKKSAGGREALTEAEAKALRALQAKAKRIQRHDEAFFAEVEERKEEVLAVLGDDTSRLGELEKALAAAYGCTIEEALEWAMSQPCIDYYKRKHIIKAEYETERCP